jgi:ribosomal protein S12 methylthiotransferase
VFGCAVNRFPTLLKNKYPSVNGWFNLNQTAKLMRAITKQDIKKDARLVTTRGYAYLKIADGCSNHCSYCTIPSIKGEFHSYGLDSLVREAYELVKLGTKEIILIGQDTTRYGVDIYGKTCLVTLIRELSKIPDLKWIRIMYAHPRSINRHIIDEIESNNKVCKYIDLPIQHINNRILQLMNRGVTTNQIMGIFKELKRIKGISLRTTVIVGFPTEHSSEFKELLEYIKLVCFDWLGAFPYFKERGTKAARLEQLPNRVINERYSKIIRLQKSLARLHNRNRLGKTYRTLIHGRNGGVVGHTEFMCPEIDGVVLSRTSKLRLGQFYEMNIADIKGYDLLGIVPRNVDRKKDS